MQPGRAQETWTDDSPYGTTGSSAESLPGWHSRGVHGAEAMAAADAESDVGADGTTVVGSSFNILLWRIMEIYGARL